MIIGIAWWLSIDEIAHLCGRHIAPVAAQRIRARVKVQPQRQKDYVALRWEPLNEEMRKSERDLKDKLSGIRIGHKLARPWGDG